VPSLTDRIESNLPGPSAGSALAWKGLTLATGVVAAVVARRAVAAVWNGVKGDSGRVDPSDRSTDWSTALQWAVASGVGVGVARVVAQRTAARVWESATGSAPPGGSAEPALRA
jgi:hypothetical protein